MQRLIDFTHQYNQSKRLINCLPNLLLTQSAATNSFFFLKNIQKSRETRLFGSKNKFLSKLVVATVEVSFVYKQEER